MAKRKKNPLVDLIKWAKTLNLIKKGIFAIVAIVALTFTIDGIYVRAAEFKKHKQEFSDYKDYQRLEYLDKRIAQLEQRHDCYGSECRQRMPLSVWEEYEKKLLERGRLEKTLYPEKTKETK